MDRKRELEKRAEFRKLLGELANDEGQNRMATEEGQKGYHRRFEDLYGEPNTEEEFRHFYSDIFLALTDKAGDSNILAENVRALWMTYHPQVGRPDIGRKLSKLYDHLSLDLARLTYNQSVVQLSAQNGADLAELRGTINSMSQERTQFREEANNLRRERDQFKSESEQLREEQDNIREDIDNAQKEYISILGIFSAVVLTFIGGIAFSTSVLQNIHQASPYRLGAIVIIIGLVLFDVLCVLFYCVGRLVHQKEWGNAPIIIISIANALLIISLVSVIIAWWFGAVECRDERIEQQMQNGLAVTQTMQPIQSQLPQSSK